MQTYEDKIRGSKHTRPAHDRLLKDVGKGGIDAVVVYKLDCLGRSLTQLALIIEELSNRGVALIFTSQGIDTSESNPSGKLQMSVLMAVAEVRAGNHSRARQRRLECHQSQGSQARQTRKASQAPQKSPGPAENGQKHPRHSLRASSASFFSWQAGKNRVKVKFSVGISHMMGMN